MVDLTYLAAPCALYVKERLGKSFSVFDLFRYPTKPFSTDTPLKRGDVLMWLHSEAQAEEVMLYYDLEKGVISEKLILNKHFCVYEGDDYISDLVLPEGSLPYIRLRKLSVCKTPYGVVILPESI